MPEDFNSFIVVSLVVCGGSGLALFVLYKTISSKAKKMAVKALGEFEQQQAEDERVDPDAPVEPRQERKLSDAMQEKADHVDFDEALRQQSGAIDGAPSAPAEQNRQTGQPAQPRQTNQAKQPAAQTDAAPPPQPESDVLQPGDPLVEHDEFQQDNPIPPPQNPPAPQADNDNTNRER
jgi:hypothetical protein